MELEAKLKEIILSRYKSLRDFCIQNDFLYSTIEGMLKRERGIMGTSVSIVIRVCNCLNIDIGELEHGKIVPKPKSIGKLSTHEEQLINAYRSNPPMQPAVDKLLGIEDAEEPVRHEPVISDDVAETVKNLDRAAQDSKSLYKK